jgi:uncharacterized iron-regulated protein
MVSRTFALLALAAALLAQDPPKVGPEHFRIYHADGRLATLDEVAEAGKRSDAVFLGETHDDPVAHYLELEMLKRLTQPKLALSMEMFESDVQGVVDEYLTGLITEDHLISAGRAWRNYKPDYKPLVDWAKEHRLPVVAANAPRRYVNRVTREGKASLTSLSKEARKSLPPLPYADAAPAYAERFRKITEGSGAPPPRDPAKQLEAQSLWDASMAYSVSRALKHNHGQVMHVNGGFHTEQRMGIVTHLLRYRPKTKVLVVTMTPAKESLAFVEKDMKDLGDFVVVTDGRLPRSYTAAPMPMTMPAARKQ